MILLCLKLVMLFLIGAITWALALYRLLAFERRQVNLLCSLVFIEEFAVLFLGVWLANNRDYLGAAALAMGGAIASRIVVKRAKVVDGSAV
mgnify:CR=1 FL=1